jgi:hypothetical protein
MAFFKYQPGMFKFVLFEIIPVPYTESSTRGNKQKEERKKIQPCPIVADPDQESGAFCAFLTPGSGIGKKSGSVIRDEHPFLRA